MSLTTPTAVPSMGTRRVVAIQTAANLDALKMSDIATAINISCYLTRSGGWAPTKEQASVPHQPYCSSQDFEIPGAKSRQLMLQYTFNLEDPTSDVARIELEEGTSLILVHFLQKNEDDDDFAIGDWYEAVPSSWASRTSSRWRTTRSTASSRRRSSAASGPGCTSSSPDPDPGGDRCHGRPPPVHRGTRGETWKEHPSCPTNWTTCSTNDACPRRMSPSASTSPCSPSATRR